MNAIRVLLFHKIIPSFLGNRVAVVLTFVVPIALIALFGEVFGLRRKQSGPTGFQLAVVNTGGQPAGDKLLAALKADQTFRIATEFINPDKTRRPLTEDDVRTLIRDGAFRYALVIPADVVPKNGFGLHLKILSNPINEIEAQTMNGLLQKAIFSHVPELLGQSLQASAKQYLGNERYATFNRTIASAVTHAFGGDTEKVQRAMEQGDFGFSTLDAATSPDADSAAKGAPAKKRNDFFTKIVKVENEQIVGANVKSPDATRVVGGWAIMFLMFALNSGATSLFDEKKSGIFQRVLSGPVTRAQILWSRFLFGVLLGLVQLVTVFIAGQALYGIDVLGHLGNLALVSVAAAAACTALGMFIASVSASPEAAHGLATFVVLGMSAVGGAWFPISFMPEFMQKLSKFTVTYWAMDGFNQVLWAGRSLVETLPTVGVLAAITAAVMAVAVWRFNRGNLFD